jgi:hypothetical protein
MQPPGRAGPGAGGLAGGCHGEGRSRAPRQSSCSAGTAANQAVSRSNSHILIDPSPSHLMLLNLDSWFQSLRKALSERVSRPDEGMLVKAPAPASYPMAPIGTVQSCFSTRCALLPYCSNLSKWFYDTFIGAATGAARCGSFV